MNCSSTDLRITLQFFQQRTANFKHEITFVLQIHSCLTDLYMTQQLDYQVQICPTDIE